MPPQPRYTSPEFRDNESYLHLSPSSPNPYLPRPDKLKFGKLKGKTEVRIDGKTTIYIQPGHNIARAVERYTRRMELRKLTGKYGGGKRYER